MFSRIRYCFYLFFFLMLALPSLSRAQEDWPIHLRFLSGPNGGQWYDMGEPIAEVLSRSVLPTTSRIGGGVANIEQVNKRMGDLAFTLTGFLGAAASGEAEYSDMEHDNTAMLANVYPQVLYFLMRKDIADEYGIANVDDLLKLEAPIRFASLRPGTASEFILQLVLQHGYNSGFDELKRKGWSIYFNNYAETADNFAEGKLDCFAYTAGTDVPLIHTIEEYTDVVILPLCPDVLERLAEKFKTGTYLIEPGDYKCIKEPVLTFGDYTCIIVRRDLPDTLAYAITKALWEGKDTIASRTADFGALSPDTAVARVPMHPGSLRFWEELRAR